MIFEFLGEQLASFSTKKLLERVLDALQPVLVNDHAFNFACEELREAYEEQLKPAAYEHVVSSLRLTRDDFIQYFCMRTPACTLKDHLRSRLIERSEGWVFNRPSSQVFSKLVDDFLNAYQRYFLTADHHLLTFTVADTSKEILAAVTEIKAALATERAGQHSKQAQPPRTLAREVRSFLTVLNIPFDVLEEHSKGVDIVVIDPSSVFPNRFLLCVRSEVNTAEELDAILAQSADLKPSASNILLVSLAPLTFEIANYAERRRISTSGFKEFQESFFKLSPIERYVLGGVASKALAESLAVYDFYISPDAVPVSVGDRMERKYYEIRESASSLVDSFLRDDSANILIILGGYGSGKSAFCAWLLLTLIKAESEYVPAYFALKQLRTADELLRVTTKADQLAKTVSDVSRRSLVLLDGLDEMPNAMSNKEKKQNMLRLLEASSRCDKLIVTARTSYFRGLEDLWHLFKRPTDTALWHAMAKSIPESGRRPSVSAIVLREFDSGQIEQYVEEFGRICYSDDDFGNRFLAEMRGSDFGFNYMFLSRNPLYLFLLVNSRPWLNPEVRCIADIFRLFIKFWLERDIEKGRSRWALTTEDRMDFMSSVAWKMFQERRHCLSFTEFDECVRKFLGSDSRRSEYEAVALDLQTTGIFNSTGNTIEFFAKGFYDYFVVSVFYNCGFKELGRPKRLPTFDQVCMWAGVAETREKRASWDTSALLQELGINEKRALSGRLTLDSSRILYPPPTGGETWPFINGHYGDGLRMIMNAAIQLAEEDRGKTRLVMMNTQGLHARAVAKVVRAMEQWRSELGTSKSPDVTLERCTEVVTLESIMGILCLGVGPGGVSVIEYSGCTVDEFHSLLQKIGCTRLDVVALGNFDPTRTPANLWLWYIDTGHDFLTPSEALELAAFDPAFSYH